MAAEFICPRCLHPSSNHVEAPGEHDGTLYICQLPGCACGDPDGYRPHEDFEAESYPFTWNGAVHGQFRIRAGHRGTKTVGKGTDREREQDIWARRVEIYISPTGRRVRIFVDGKEVE